LRNYGSGIGVSIVITVLSRTQSTSHAYMAEQANPYSEAMQAPWLPEQWDILTNDGLAMLNAEVNRQALALGFLNDFTLIMIGSLISVPLVFLLARGRAAPGEPAADGPSK